MNEELEKQDELFAGIMRVCNQQPSARVLQVLIDSLACTVLCTGTMTIDQVVNKLRRAYCTVPPDAIPTPTAMGN